MEGERGGKEEREWGEGGRDREMGEEKGRGKREKGPECLPASYLRP